MTPTLRLPDSAGVGESYRLAEPCVWPKPNGPIRSRVAYAAAHVVPDPFAEPSASQPIPLDWGTTLALREELWADGFGVADAMDTAQRGMGLDWPTTQELIRRSGERAQGVGGRLACGAGTDQLDLAAVPDGAPGLEMIADAYREQIEVVTSAGARVILMASRALARIARGPEDYRHIYDQLLAELDQPAILHWLGPMFDPALDGYWGSTDLHQAGEVFLGLLHDYANRVDGVKVSLLDADYEVWLRRQLPNGVHLYTGDDYNYPELIIGDGTHHSDTLLGVFAGIHPAASAGLQALDSGDPDRARAILDNTLPLGRHLFVPPTPYYKTGISFLSWLRGAQPGFTMVGGLQSARSVPHLVELFKLADRTGLLPEPELAAWRMGQYLATKGWSA
jgi:hypothetical protein